jgi:hypothetical protein
MSDEQTVRGLLARAAELPEDVNPPVQRLLHQARRARTRRRAAYSVLSAIAVAAVAVVAAVPSLVGGLGAASPEAPRMPSSGIFPASPQAAPSGPATAELSRFRWSALPPSPLGRRAQPILTWTGNELIELAGPNGPADAPSGWNGAAAAFTPATGSWHRIAPVPETMQLPGAFSVWTGRQLFVTNASVPPNGKAPVGSSAALYDPATNRWTATALPQQLADATQLAATWTGEAVVVAGAGGGQVSAAALNPATGEWTLLPSPVLPARHPARYLSIVATPDRLIIWSLWDRVTRTSDGFSDYAGVDVLALSRDGAWSNVTHGWPQEQNVPSPAYSGSAILVSPGQVWCGTACSPPYSSFPGYFADPATLHRAVIAPGPLGQTAPAFVWTGGAILAVDLSDQVFGPGGPNARPADMAGYDPATGRWRVLPAPPGYPPPSATPVWAGTQLLELTNAGQLLTFHR